MISVISVAHIKESSSGPSPASMSSDILISMTLCVIQSVPCESDLSQRHKHSVQQQQLLFEVDKYLQ